MVQVFRCLLYNSKIIESNPLGKVLSSGSFSTVLNLPLLLYFWLLTWSNIWICRTSLQEMKTIFHFVGIDIFPVMYSLGSQNQSTCPDFLLELFSTSVKLVSTLNFCIPTSSNIFRIHIHNFLWFVT